MKIVHTQSWVFGTNSECGLVRRIVGGVGGSVYRCFCDVTASERKLVKVNALHVEVSCDLETTPRTPHPHTPTHHPSTIIVIHLYNTSVVDAQHCWLVGGWDSVGGSGQCWRCGCVAKIVELPTISVVENPPLRFHFLSDA